MLTGMLLFPDMPGVGTGSIELNDMLDPVGAVKALRPESVY